MNTVSLAYREGEDGKLRRVDFVYYIIAPSIEDVRTQLRWIAEELPQPVLFVTEQRESFITASKL